MSVRLKDGMGKAFVRFLDGGSGEFDQESLLLTNGPRIVESALSDQVGGDHYRTMPIQPVEYIHKNGLGYIEGAVVKYVTRHRAKNGAEDIRKAIHFLHLLLELEYGEK